MNGNRRGQGVEKDGGYRRHLPEYNELNSEEFAQVVARFRVDMEMFGYNYTRDERTGEVYAKCEQLNCEWW